MAAAPATPAAGGPPSAGAPPSGGGATPGGIIPPIPPNKPGEPVFGLKLDPEAKLIFKGDNLVEAPTTIEVKLTNPTKDRQTFKVKCTSNKMFQVCPPLGYCDPEATVPIKITFQNDTIPDSARHYVAFYHMKSDEKVKPARQVWTPQSKFEGVRRIMVYFEKMDGTPASGPPKAGSAPAEGAPPAAPPAAAEAGK